MLDTINISNANVTLGGLAGVSALTAYNIGAGGTLNLTSTLGVAAGSTVGFTAPNSHLVLGSGINLALLSGIAGFGPGRNIDVSALATSVTYADNPGANTGGVLTLLDPSANPVGTLNFTNGDFTAGSFRLTPDGAGGTLVDFATTVTGIAATPATGDLGVGQTANITLTTSDGVTVAGVPLLTLNDGGVAAYNAAASTPTSLVFTTTVAAGQNTPDLAVTGVNLNGGSLLNGVGTAVNLAAAVGNPAGTLQIDGTIPTVVGVATNPGSGSVTTGQPVNIAVATSEPVTVVGGPPTLTLNSGGTALYNPGASTPTSLVFTYTPAAGQSSADLAVTAVNLNGSTIADPAGNAADLSGAVTNPPGILVVDTGFQPFAPLVVGNPDSSAIVTVSARTQPAVTGTYSNLGTGSIGADGVTYTVVGTAAQVTAALAGVTLLPTTLGTRATGLAATMSDTSPSSTSTLTNTGALPATLTVTSAGDSLQAGSGNDTLIAGAGNTFINGGPGADTLVGNVAGGTVRGGTGNSVLFARGDNTLVIGQGAADTISAATGTVTVISALGGRSVIGLGTGAAIVNGQGADTLIGGSGNVAGGISTGSTAVLGSGQAIISAQQGTTVVGGSGADTVGVRGSGILFVAGSGPAYFIGGTGASTVQGGTGGSSTINGGGGGGLLNGGTGGNNFIVGGQQGTTIFGGGNNDVLFAVGSAGTVIRAGNGNETLQGIGSSGNDTFFAGSGNNLIGLGSGQDAVFGGTGNATVVAGTGRDIFAFTNGTAGGTETIVGFKVGTDLLSLQGYAAGEASRALAAAQSTPGTSTTAPATTLTLSDNTRITFSGLASVDARVFG